MASFVEKCPNCDKVSTRQIDEPSKIMDCPHCGRRFCPQCVEGTGQVDDTQNVRCPKCKGFVSLYGHYK